MADRFGHGATRITFVPRLRPFGIINAFIGIAVLRLSGTLALLATHSARTYMPRSLRSFHYKLSIAPTRASAFLLSKARRVSMSIREVTFEELLAILRSPPELVAKTAAPPENSDRYNVDNARGQSRDGGGRNPPR